LRWTGPWRTRAEQVPAAAPAATRSPAASSEAAHEDARAQRYAEWNW
jgi:hypothetical protein